MAVNLSKALNIEKEETGVVALLLLQSVFIGIFAGALDVGANALFLEAYGADMIPKAFMFSGIAGIILTTIYSFFQSRTGFRGFAVVNLVFVVLATAALRFIFEITDNKLIVFMLFVMMGPLTIITMLGFWGTAGRFFTLRQGKRLFGIIDMGQILGMILAFYAVPVLLNFNFKVLDTLVISVFSALLALILQIVITRRFSFLPVKKVEEKKKPTGLFDLFRRKYTALMAGFVILSVITAFFIHYSFLWVTEANNPDGRSTAVFLGAFMGTMMIFTVVLKSFLYGWLMKSYGLKIALLISPIIVVLLTITAAFVGHFLGYDKESSFFILFFLLIALSKLFNKSFKDAMEVPSMKILYQSLDSRERYDIQARIDGTVNEITAFSAGLLMAGLMLLSFVRIIHFTYILVFILIAWIFVGAALYRKYRQSLESSLANARKEEDTGSRKDFFSFEPAERSRLTREMLLLNPFFYHVSSKRELDGALEAEDVFTRKTAWKLVDQSLYRPGEELLNKALSADPDPEIREIASRIAERLKDPGKDLLKLFRSAKKEKIMAALHAVVRNGDTGHLPQIITLLRDTDILIRKAAIEAAGRLKAKEIGSYLVDYLGHPELGFTAWSALVNTGEGVLENLENAFHRSGQTTDVQMRIVNAMGAIGGPLAWSFLEQKISYHHREVRRNVISLLYESDYKPGDSIRNGILETVRAVVEAGAWLIAAEQSVRDNNPENGLYEALKGEQRTNNALLFRLLGLAYDKQVVEHVSETLLEEESDDRGFAVELLNLVVDEQVKEYLEPYFDDRSVSEKIRILQTQFPVEILPFDKLIGEILNRDGLWLGNYCRACAIDAVSGDQNFDAGMYLAAQAFHPEKIISGLALMALQNKSADLYNSVSTRLVRYHESSDRLGTREIADEPGAVMDTMKELEKWQIFNEVSEEERFHFAGKVKKLNKELTESEIYVTFLRDLSTFESGSSPEYIFIRDNTKTAGEENTAADGDDNAKIRLNIRVDEMCKLAFTSRELYVALQNYFIYEQRKITVS